MVAKWSSTGMGSSLLLTNNKRNGGCEAPSDNLSGVTIEEDGVKSFVDK